MVPTHTVGTGQSESHSAPFRFFRGSSSCRALPTGMPAAWRPTEESKASRAVDTKTPSNDPSPLVAYHEEEKEEVRAAVPERRRRAMTKRKTRKSRTMTKNKRERTEWMWWGAPHEVYRGHLWRMYRTRTSWDECPSFPLSPLLSGVSPPLSVQRASETFGSPFVFPHHHHPSSSSSPLW